MGSTTLSPSTTVEPSDCNTDPLAYLSAIIIGIFRLLSSLLLARLLKHYRRRNMYFVSAFATIISLLFFATCDLLVDNDWIYNCKTKNIGNSIHDIYM